MLEQIQLTKGGALSKWQRFRVLTNFGAANLMVEEGKIAARYFLDAAALAPDDETGVGNEVLAYHLLLQEKETREKATTAIERFPNSTRIRALWIQSAPQEKTYEELHDATPAQMRNDDEVASALCRRALACGQLDRAIEHAKDAIADNPKWSQSHLLLAQAYFARVAGAERTVKPLNAEEKAATLAKSLALCDAAISAAEAECVQFVKAHAFALKTDIALIQGRKEDAARFAREAFGAGPGELNGRLALAESFIAIGNADEGIRILEEVHALSKAAANVCFMLGEALLHRGALQDLKRAFEVFSTANLANLPRELVDPLTVGAVRALAMAERFGEIDGYAGRPEVVGSPAMVATIKAYAAFRQAHQPEATQFLNQAVAGRCATDSQSLTNFLGKLLLEAGRASDALPLLQELFAVQNPNFDVGLLLHCAGLLEKEQIILDTCQTLYDRGHRDWRLLEFESQYLVERDHQKAISRLREFIAANPDHRLAKLRLALVAMRYGQNDLSPLSESTLPTPVELPMRYAVAAVRVLQWQGQAKFAVDYAYRVLRAHTTEFEAHKAYLASLVEGARPDDIPATMNEVAIGSAVAFSEKSDGPIKWRVIEDTDKPTKEFKEISVSDDLAKALLGKRVGDTFVLSKNPVKDRIGTITQVLSKYTWRFQVVGGEMELKFPGQTFIWTMQVPPPEKITVADIQPMLDRIKARSEVVTKLREIYRTTSITLNMYGAKLGNGPCEALFDLATSEEDFVRCAHPTPNALTDAVATLETKRTVVLDLVALTTLRLLGITRQILTSGRFRFIISAATYTELQKLRAKARFSTPHGTIFYKDNQHYMTQTTQKQSEREKAAFEEWMQCVEKNTTVVSVPEIATLDPERRKVLEKAFGCEGLEAAFAALAPDSILWTDDLVFAEYAKSEVGGQRVWTQAIVEYLTIRGHLDRELAEETYAKLVGFNYQSTHFRGMTMVAALRVSHGSIDAFPMRQIIQAFGPLAASPLAADRRNAFLMLGGFVLQLSLEPFLPETKCIATKALLDTFPTDPADRRQLELFSVGCAKAMNLNPVGRADFLRCFEQWKREKLTL